MSPRCAVWSSWCVAWLSPPRVVTVVGALWEPPSSAVTRPARCLAWLSPTTPARRDAGRWSTSGVDSVVCSETSAVVVFSRPISGPGFITLAAVSFVTTPRVESVVCTRPVGVSFRWRSISDRDVVATIALWVDETCAPPLRAEVELWDAEVTSLYPYAFLRVVDAVGPVESVMYSPPWRPVVVLAEPPCRVSIPAGSGSTDTSSVVASASSVLSLPAVGSVFVTATDVSSSRLVTDSLVVNGAFSGAVTSVTFSATTLSTVETPPYRFEDTVDTSVLTLRLEYETGTLWSAPSYVVSSSLLSAAVICDVFSSVTLLSSVEEDSLIPVVLRLGSLVYSDVGRWFVTSSSRLLDDAVVERPSLMLLAVVCSLVKTSVVYDAVCRVMSPMLIDAVVSRFAEAVESFCSDDCVVKVLVKLMSVCAPVGTVDVTLVWLLTSSLLPSLLGPLVCVTVFPAMSLTDAVVAVTAMSVLCGKRPSEYDVLTELCCSPVLSPTLLSANALDSRVDASVCALLVDISDVLSPCFETSVDVHVCTVISSSKNVPVDALFMLVIGVAAS